MSWGESLHAQVLAAFRDAQQRPGELETGDDTEKSAFVGSAARAAPPKKASDLAHRDLKPANRHADYSEIYSGTTKRLQVPALAEGLRHLVASAHAVPARRRRIVSRRAE